MDENETLEFPRAVISAIQRGLTSYTVREKGQAVWGFEKPGLEGGAPACSRGLELGDLKGPFQPKPFYDSVILLTHENL